MTAQLELGSRASAVAAETVSLRRAFHAAWVVARQRHTPESRAAASAAYDATRGAWHAHLATLSPAAQDAAWDWWQSTSCGDPNRVGVCACERRAEVSQ